MKLALFVDHKIFGKISQEKYFVHIFLKQKYKKITQKQNMHETIIFIIIGLIIQCKIGIERERAL